MRVKSSHHVAFIVTALVLIVLTMARSTFADDPVVVTGRLLDSTGQPADDVAICLTTRFVDLAISSGKLPPPQDRDFIAKWVPGCNEQWFAITDAQGRFSFPRPAKPFMLLVGDRRGYLILHVDEHVDLNHIKLAEWATIEGELFFGDKPAAAGAPVEILGDEIRMTDDLFVSCNLPAATTDPKGHFKFDRVFAGSYELTRGGERVRVHAISGKPAHVVLKCLGRPVAGKIALPSSVETSKTAIVQNSFGCRRTFAMPEFKVTEDLKKLSQEQLIEWVTNWKATAEGQAVYDHFQASGEQRWNERSQDLSFRFEELVPGEYSIPMTILGRNPSDGSPDYTKVLGGMVCQFVVPPFEGGYTAEPLDVGTLEARESTGGLRLGQIAPDFPFRDVRGSAMTLGQYKGKVILLDFWGTWCPGCVTGIPQLRELHKQFKDNPDFVLVSLDHEDTPAKLLPFIQEHGMTWINTCQGEPDTSLPALLYGVRGYPSFFLIGRDGTIKYEDFNPDGLQSAITKALAEPSK